MGDPAPWEMRDGGDSSEWMRSAAFRDRNLTDDEFLFALSRAAPGDFQRLLVCSSRLTDKAVKSALAPHWPALVDLCISNCGRFCGKRITGESLAPLLQSPSRALQCLVAIDVPHVPLTSIAACCNLHTLLLCGGLAEPCVESLSGCHNLEVLKLTLAPKVVQDPFIRVFKHCHKLRVIDIHGATDVSDQMLACLMLNNACLEDLRGSYAGGGFSRALNERVLHAFQAHFAGAAIFIDNLVKESVL